MKEKKKSKYVDILLLNNKKNPIKIIDTVTILNKNAYFHQANYGMILQSHFSETKFSLRWG